MTVLAIVLFVNCWAASLFSPMEIWVSLLYFLSRIKKHISDIVSCIYFIRNSMSSRPFLASLLTDPATL